MPRNWSKYTKEQKQRIYKDCDLRRLYKITIKDFDNLIEKQNNKCPICTLELDKTKSQIDVDHCHITGKVRGILHNRCNQILGAAKDNVELIKAAIAYLQKT